LKGGKKETKNKKSYFNLRIRLVRNEVHSNTAKVSEEKSRSGEKTQNRGKIGGITRNLHLQSRGPSDLGGGIGKKKTNMAVWPGKSIMMRSRAARHQHVRQGLVGNA